LVSIYLINQREALAARFQPAAVEKAATSLAAELEAEIEAEIEAVNEKISAHRRSRLEGAKD
jgi:hypothetical protein